MCHTSLSCKGKLTESLRFPEGKCFIRNSTAALCSSLDHLALGVTDGGPGSPERKDDWAFPMEEPELGSQVLHIYRQFWSQV